MWRYSEEKNNHTVLSRIMTIPKPMISLFIATILVAPVHADDTPHLDDMVASGIVFKLVCLFGSEGTWSTMETENSASFQAAIGAISKDLRHFSNTERGVTLQKNGEELISFLSKGVLLTSEPPAQGAPDAEAEQFFRNLDLDPKSADPADLARIFTERIEIYAQQSNTPPWVYDRTKRESGPGE